LYGFAGGVFHGFFYIIEEHLRRVTKELRLSSKILASYNATFFSINTKNQIILLLLKNTRPISLCNYIYKDFAKIIARRVKRLLSNTISNEKFGFLEGRKIHEVVGVAQEGLHTIKVKKLK
jgi:hypothetical protein